MTEITTEYSSLLNELGSLNDLELNITRRRSAIAHRIDYLFERANR